jgi:hypothetical protein
VLACCTAQPKPAFSLCAGLLHSTTKACIQSLCWPAAQQKRSLHPVFVLACCTAQPKPAFSLCAGLLHSRSEACIQQKCSAARVVLFAA